MNAQTGFFSRRSALFSRRYRAALLDYLLGSGETGLLHAYALGRTAIDEGFGPLQILWAHHRAVNSVLESSHNSNDSKSLKAAEDFLMETLSPFEMTYRGYVALLKRDREKPGLEGFSTWNGTERRRGTDRRVAVTNDGNR